MATDLPNDTEAAIKYIKSLLPVNVTNTLKYPPIVFINQIYDIIHNKTLINRELVSNNSFNHILKQIFNIKFYFVGNITETV